MCSIMSGSGVALVMHYNAEKPNSFGLCCFNDSLTQLGAVSPAMGEASRDPHSAQGPHSAPETLRCLACSRGLYHCVQWSGRCLLNMQAGELMGVLLGGVARLGMNALLVRRMVTALASRARGRAALRIGVALWQRKAGGMAAAGEVDAKAALQWAVSHLWQLGVQQAPADAMGILHLHKPRTALACQLWLLDGC